MWKSSHHSVPGNSRLFGWGGRYRCDCNRLFHRFRFSSSWSTAYETGGLRRGFKDSHLGKGIPCRLYTKGKSRRATILGSQSNLRCAARERFGPTTVSSVRKWYLEEHRLEYWTLTDDCEIYRKITNKNDTQKLQKDLDTLGEWAVENGMKINHVKSKAIRFTRAQVKNPLG